MEHNYPNINVKAIIKNAMQLFYKKLIVILLKIYIHIIALE